MKSFCRLALAFSLIFTAAMARHRFIQGRPALLDFAAFQDSGPLPFIRPPFYQPLRGLPLETAAAVWLCLNVAAGFGFGLWAERRTGDPAVALLLALYVPALVALSVGQDTLLLLAALSGVFVLLESGRTVAAGLLLAVLWVKFPWLPAFLLLLASRREWRALGAWLAGTLLLWIPVFTQIPAYALLLWRNAADPLVIPCRTCMPNLHALIPDSRVALAASVALLALSAWRFRGPLPQAFALASATALVTSPHAHMYDCVLLFLAVILVMGSSLIRAWALSPLPYLLPYLFAPLRVIPALTALTVVGSLWCEKPREDLAG